MDKVALFDFCGTIVRPQTAALFCKSFLRESRGFPAFLINILRTLNIFFLNYPISPLWLLLMRGTSSQAVEEFALTFAHDLYRQELIPEVVERIEWHKKNHYKVIIVSAGLRVYIARIAKLLGVHDVIATELDVVHGILTGRITKDGHCHGENKVLLLKHMIGNNLIDWDNSYAYTDNASDVPMLNLVGNPFFVVCREGAFKILEYSDKESYEAGSS